MAKKGQKFIFIDEDLIKKGVREKIYGKSYSYLSEKYHVPVGSIKTWVKKFQAFLKRQHDKK